ncbi:MAG: phosphate/phosphite/phosphonate ABC transporter substrate-binding protein [Candidatus Izemoplasmatales bacterium]|jgi:phosphonate transport system substrate-binding protein|nr:phosphate/phosphite/phosphonate ABC transporter substrate-binding protein [Candidatus Izemoplasmatales bacterium]
MKKVLSAFFVFMFAFAFVACNAATTAAPTTEDNYLNPSTLRVQLIPSRDAAVLNAQRAPLQDLLMAELGMDVVVTVATDYNALIEAMKSEQIHVGLLATASYVLAHEEGAAEVILKSLRYDVDDNGNLLTDAPLVDGYKSQLVVAADSGITSIADLEGKTIAIASFTSTSGFVWPANLLADNGLDPMTDVTWINAGGHDAAILAVYNGQADAAFTFKDARTLVEGDYPDVYDEVVFVANTESIPNDTISVIPRLHPELVAKIKAAFIAIAETEEGRAIIRAVYNHEGYAEAVDSEYDIVRTYLERQEDWDF